MNRRILLSKRFLAITALILFVAFRLFLAIWVGSFGPDESARALQVKEIFDGAPLPLVSCLNTHGLYNGPYQIYLLAIIYLLTGFHLAFGLLLASGLYIAAAFLIASAVSSKEMKWWVLLFALTSPLQIYFSMAGLADSTIFFLLPALVLFLHSKDGSRLWRELIIGCLLGIAFGVHISALPFAAGVILSRLYLYRGKFNTIILGQSIGLLLGVFPYAVGLWINRFGMSPILVRPGDRIAHNLVDVPLSLFRFFGVQANVRINGSGMPLFAENLLAHLTTVIIIILFLMSSAFFYYNRKRTASSPVLMAVFLCAFFYIPFGWISNTLALSYGGQVIWWITPVIIPAVLLWLLPRKEGVVCLSFLLIFNLIVIAFQYTKRVSDGTQASYTYGHGPSWWAYEDVASSLCAEVNNQSPKQDVTVVEMSSDMHMFSRVRIGFILKNLVKLKYSDCAQRIAWFGTGKGRILRIEPCLDQIHLRVAWGER